METKKSSYKNLENKIDCKGNTTLAKREVRRRHRQIWYKFEQGPYRSQLKLYKSLKQISKDIKETVKINGNR
jgi:hypothetical protein